jgi:DNA-binding SARP family transcriptional activator
MIAKGQIFASPNVPLAHFMGVDIRSAKTLANRLLSAVLPEDASDPDQAMAALSIELQPDLQDDGALIEAEAWNQLRMEALVVLAQELTTRKFYGAAACAALAAINVEPLRETPHATLIRVRLAQGDGSGALAVFQSYKALLGTELGLVPTRRIEDLIRDVKNVAR